VLVLGVIGAGVICCMGLSNGKVGKCWSAFWSVVWSSVVSNLSVSGL
jgi:hypothetical protein